MTTALKRQARAWVAIGAAIYARVSVDRTGEAKSPTQQVAAQREACAARGIPVAAQFVDNNVGAGRHSRGTRPEFNRLLDALANPARGWNVLTVWEASRLSRDTVVFAQLLDACRVNGVRLMVGTGEPLDLEDPTNELALTVPGVVGAYETGMTRKRVMRNATAAAEAGRPHGRLTYGYRRVYDGRGQFTEQVPDEVQAPIVREIATRLVGGDGAKRIARDLNERGVRTNAGKAWTHATIKRMFTTLTYIGVRTHHGEIVATDCWPALLDEATFYAARTVVAAAKPHGGDGGRAIRNREAVELLSGMFTCTKCEGRCYATAIKGAAYYRCDRGCVARKVERADAVVLAHVFDVITRPGALDAWAKGGDDPTPGLRAELKAIEASIAETEDAIAARDMPPVAGGRIIGKLEVQRDALRGRLDAFNVDVPAGVVALTEADDARAEFDRWGSEAQRTVLRAMLHDGALIARGVGGKRDTLGLRFRWAGGDTVEL